MMGYLPRSVYSNLVAGGRVYTGAIPGSSIPETIFAPEGVCSAQQVDGLADH
jgi:hypothetical protein